MEKSPMMNNLVQYNQQSKQKEEEDQKFNIINIDCMISNKTMSQQQKPCKAYIEIQFNKENEVAFFNYIVLQNFYTYSVTIKQFKGIGGDPKEMKKVENNWVTVLKDYQLMRNAHFETDAQNWHIIGTELFNAKFERRTLKYLRIYLKQPSPSWLDYTLRNITLYMKKIELKFQSTITQSAHNLGGKEISSFDQMKMSLRNNLKGLKKDEEKENDSSQPQLGPQKRVQDIIPPFSYGEDIRKIDLLYNIQ